MLVSTPVVVALATMPRTAADPALKAILDHDLRRRRARPRLRHRMIVIMRQETCGTMRGWIMGRAAVPAAAGLSLATATPVLITGRPPVR
jgi:hypothetical protein